MMKVGKCIISLILHADCAFLGWEV